MKESLDTDFTNHTPMMQQYLHLQSNPLINKSKYTNHNKWYTYELHAIKLC